MENKSVTKRVLIVNQHGENRGDEAAMRAMIKGLEKELGDVKITIVAQFQDTDLRLSFKQDVELLHMKMPHSHLLGLLLYSVGRLFKASIPFLLSSETKKIIESSKLADLVVSAPGGPYFGDIYYQHELLHWFYVFLACLYKKPLFLYAPSAGPFNIKPMNVVRKCLFKEFDVLCVREEISQEYLRTLLGDDVIIYLTADSALQESLESLERTDYFKGERAYLANKYLVSVSAIQYKYPGQDEIAEHQAMYTKAILRCLEHIGSKKDCHFLFLPQLYGRVHSDVPYLEHLGQSLSPGFSWEVVDPSADSDMQRRLFGMTDLCIASRYHPQIFAACSGVPGICIYYEHKALGFMSSLGLKDFAFDIRNLDADALCAKLDEAMEGHDELSAHIKKNIVKIQNRARRTTRLAVQCLYAAYGSP
jgi:polysaccharide pyruvyl transferase WcaK-like protein